MDNLDLRKTLTVAAVATALGVAATPAGAVVYNSVFDPTTFSGVATFDVDEACLSIGTGFISNGSYDCDVTWLTATVTLDDGSSTTTFDYHPAFLPSNPAVNNIYVSGSDLAGVNSDTIGPVIVPLSSPGFAGPWWIEYSFSLSTSDFAALNGGPGNGLFGYGIVNLWTCTPSASTVPCGTPNTLIDTADVLSFTRVPEPGTVALALAAAWGAWFARRRQRYVT